jgi:hypothetical protein
MKFQITYKATGEVVKYRSNQWIDFEYAVWDISRYVSTFNTPELDYEFVVEGKIVSLDLAEKAAVFARKEWEAKRSMTKKQVWISQGATALPNTYRQVWVKK